LQKTGINIFYFIIVYNDQTMHNYLTNYYTAPT